MNEDSIKRCVAGVVARLDMGIVDFSDFWMLLDAARQEIESCTNIVYPEGHVHNYADILLGNIMGTAVYEYTHLVDNGEVSDRIKVEVDDEEGS